LTTIDRLPRECREAIEHAMAQDTDIQTRVILGLGRMFGRIEVAIASIGMRLAAEGKLHGTPRADSIRERVTR
jgi:hypothetical protein